MAGWWGKFRQALRHDAPRIPGWWAKSNEIARAERQKMRKERLQIKGNLQRTGHPTAPSYPVEPGAHAEVTGITGEGPGNSSQQAVLVIAYPDGRAFSLRLHQNYRVQNAIMFAARFNMACSRADGSAAPERMTL
jgi:hypothetical protein